MELPNFEEQSASASQSFDRNFDDPGQSAASNGQLESRSTKIHPLPSNTGKDEHHEEEEAEEDAFKVPEESKVGKKLSELTTKRVIILVLGMMFGLPLFTVDLYEEENTSY
jgi:hypothetical protein